MDMCLACAKLQKDMNTGYEQHIDGSMSNKNKIPLSVNQSLKQEKSTESHHNWPTAFQLMQRYIKQ